ncbi:MAG TPA: MoxR family ATPase [Streptosporangiales bacterium]
MPTPTTLTASEAVAVVHADATGILDEVEKAVVGKRAVLELVLLGILSGGHVLLEDLPGLGKTLMARSFATALGLEFARVQFTPDLLPSDLTGANFYDQAAGVMTFRPGPVFTNLLLADEINRTPPKTQAALLEAMSEGQVSADGETRRLPAPFVVLATDNPIEYEGTYPLPEAQLDRFVLRVRLGYLPPDGEARMLRQRLAPGGRTDHLTARVGAERLVQLQDALDLVEIDDDVVDYAVALVTATRENPQVVVGASPRGSLALLRLARGRAALAGRDYVLPDDVKTVAVPALAHRISLRPELWVRRITPERVVGDILDQVPTPATRRRQR